MTVKLAKRNILQLPEPKKQKAVRLHLIPQEQEVLYLHVNGKSVREISDALGIETNWIYNILKRPACVAALKEYDEIFRMELHAMQKDVVDGMRKLVRSPDPDVIAKGINMWNKMHNKYESTLHVNLSAEDIIEQIMRRRGNVD